MEIDVKNIKAAYRTATESERTLLFTLFPDLHLDEDNEEKDSRSVTERIKTFEDAVKELGTDNPIYYAYENAQAIFEQNGNDYNLLAYTKLRIITAALNEGWQPQYTKDELRWYPWFCLWTDEELSEKSDEWKQEHHLIDFDEYFQGEWAGFAFAYSLFDDPSNASTNVGSRLCYQSEALADYSGRQFADLWADFYLIRK